MIPEEAVSWQEIPEEKRQQVIVILVEMLLREIGRKKDEVKYEGGE